jgi:hypothetical protein
LVDEDVAGNSHSSAGKIGHDELFYVGVLAKDSRPGHIFLLGPGGSRVFIAVTRKVDQFYLGVAGDIFVVGLH